MKMKNSSKNSRSVSEGGQTTAERHVTIPLMIRSHDNIQFVEEDTDTVSENEPTSGIGRVSPNGAEGNIYTEIPQRRRKMGFLEIPRFIRSHSRSNSPENSSTQESPSLERKISWRKKSNHDYEQISVTSNTSKKSTVERIAESSFFRRRMDTSSESKKIDNKGDDDEHFLEALRQVVRKCTNVDPVKRPSSTDVLSMLSTTTDKS